MKFCLACWLKSLILLHFGFHLFADVLRFRIPLSFVVLLSRESALSHWLRGPRFVVVAQHLAEVWPLIPSRTLRNSFVIGNDG